MKIKVGNSNAGSQNDQTGKNWPNLCLLSFFVSGKGPVAAVTGPSQSAGKTKEGSLLSRPQ
jgi:hypothetical protein